MLAERLEQSEQEQREARENAMYNVDDRYCLVGMDEGCQADYDDAPDERPEIEEEEEEEEEGILCCSGSESRSLCKGL